MPESEINAEGIKPEKPTAAAPQPQVVREHRAGKALLVLLLAALPLAALAWYWDNLVALTSHYRRGWLALFGLSILVALFRARGLFRDLGRDRGFGALALSTLELLLVLLLPPATLLMAQAAKGRALSTDDVTGLRRDLGGLPATKILLVGIQGDQESIRFARVLKAQVFDSLNWPVSGVWEDTLVGGAGEGILIRQTPTCTNLPGMALVEALNKRHLSARLIKIPDLDCDQLEIIVGARPE